LIQERIGLISMAAATHHEAVRKPPIIPKLPRIGRLYDRNLVGVWLSRRVYGAGLE
jgi:hypothetical protein